MGADECVIDTCRFFRGDAADDTWTVEYVPDLIRLHDCGRFHRASEPCPDI